MSDATPRRKPDVKQCHCAAFNSDECTCGAWDDAERSSGLIFDAVDAECSCRGRGVCQACRVWARLYPENKMKPE